MIYVIRMQRMPDVAAQPTRQRNEPGTGLGSQPLAPDHGASAVLPLDIAAGHELGQVAIAVAILHEQQ